MIPMSFILIFAMILFFTFSKFSMKYKEDLQVSRLSVGRELTS